MTETFLLTFLPKETLEPIMKVHGITEAFQACVKGDLESFKLCDEFQKSDNYGRTPIYMACQNGNVNIVRWLINNSKDATKELFKAIRYNFISSYNSNYFCEVHNFKREGRDLVVFFTVRGDGSLGRIQQPSRSVLLCNPGNILLRPSNVKILTSTIQFGRKRINEIRGSIYYQLPKGDVNPDSFNFTYGAGGYSTCVVLAPLYDKLHKESFGSSPFIAACRGQKFEIVLLCLDNNNVVVPCSSVRKWFTVLNKEHQEKLYQIAKQKIIDHSSFLAFMTIVYHINDGVYKDINKNGKHIIPSGHILKLRGVHQSSMIIRLISDFTQGNLQSRNVWNEIISNFIFIYCL